MLSGEVRFKHGNEVIGAVVGSLGLGPRGPVKAFHVDSAEARLPLGFGPSGVEGGLSRGRQARRVRRTAPGG